MSQTAADQDLSAQAYPAELRRPRHLGLLVMADSLFSYVVALSLLALAGLVLWRTLDELITTNQPLATAATSAVNGVLFAIIILEVMRTVLQHLQHGGLQLQPFLIIGIISAVRSILGVGARLSLQGSVPDASSGVVHTALLELGVNAAVVVGLACALVLIRRHAGVGDN